MRTLSVVVQTIAMASLVALVLAIMVFASMSVAFAAPTNTTLKVNTVTGHTYKYFQLFVGDLASDGKTLSNVKWGSDVADSITYYKKATDDATTFTVEDTVSPTAGELVPQDVLDYVASLTGGTTVTETVQTTAETIAAWVKETGHEVSSTEVSVPTGYYVIKDAFTDSSAAQTTTISTHVVAIVGPTTVTPKADTTTHKKEVLDVNDTTDTQIDLTKLKNVDSGWAKTADHDVGDRVPFKLTTTLAADYAKYDTYYLAINDTMAQGLVLETADKASFEVYVNGVKATEGEKDATDGTYSLTTTDKGFKIEFKDLKKNTNAAGGVNVVVYYTATLGETNVVFGNDGNINTSYAEYSNNPNSDQTGDTHSKTPEDTAVVFTYKPEVDKINENNQPLAGAEFTLYKEVKDEIEGTTQKGSAIKASLATQDAAIKAGELGDNKNYIVKAMTLIQGETTKFEFKGIDDGTYVLVETKIPNGYNAFDSKTITVTAKHDDTTKKVTELTANDVITTTDFNAGTLTGNVKNQKGATLPETGGIGTTIFYVAGSILVLAAAILLITKRRMGSND